LDVRAQLFASPARELAAPEGVRFEDEDVRLQLDRNLVFSRAAGY
jgi:hypothetical protein